MTPTIDKEPIKLNELELSKGKQFKYIFDFGHEWCFQCKVLQVIDEKNDETIVIKSVGEAPFQYDFDYDFDDIDDIIVD